MKSVGFSREGAGIGFGLHFDWIFGIFFVKLVVYVFIYIYISATVPRRHELRVHSVSRGPCHDVPG